MWKVYQRQAYQKKTRTVIATEDENEAIAALLSTE
jgi:hypothetical protein